MYVTFREKIYRNNNKYVVIIAEKLEVDFSYLKLFISSFLEIFLNLNILDSHTLLQINRKYPNAHQ
jgi:hypothetical protein